jgi:hypothetical protein
MNGLIGITVRATPRTSKQRNAGEQTTGFMNI